MAPLATVVPIFSIGFVGYGFGKYIIADTNQETLTSSRILFAGFVSGAATTVVTVPAERIKCLLQMQVKRAIANTLTFSRLGYIRVVYFAGCTHSL